MWHSAGSSMADWARNVAITVCFLGLWSPLVGCSSGDVIPCPVEAKLTQLCIINENGSILIGRLATTKVGHPTQKHLAIRGNLENDLTDVHLVRDEPLTIAIGPKEGLPLVELDVYSSKNGLDHAIPVLSVECDDVACSKWNRSQTRNGQIIQIPQTDLEAGFVVIVRAFVNRIDESGTVSWGLLIDSD